MSLVIHYTKMISRGDLRERRFDNFNELSKATMFEGCEVSDCTRKNYKNVVPTTVKCLKTLAKKVNEWGHIDLGTGESLSRFLECIRTYEKVQPSGWTSRFAHIANDLSLLPQGFYTRSNVRKCLLPSTSPVGPTHYRHNNRDEEFIMETTHGIYDPPLDLCKSLKSSQLIVFNQIGVLFKNRRIYYQFRCREFSRGELIENPFNKSRSAIKFSEPVSEWYYLNHVLITPDKSS